MLILKPNQIGKKKKKKELENDHVIANSNISISSYGDAGSVMPGRKRTLDKNVL